MDGERKKIMLVDDNITNLTIGKRALVDNYDVFTIPSGEKLLQMLERMTPDLILLDIEMPEMNGYDVIKRIKSKKETSDIPVIFLTAKSDSLSELEGLSLGAVDYISKPFSPPLLLKRIELHLLVEMQQRELLRYNDNLKQMVDEKTKTIFELQNAVLKIVAELVEFRDSITGGHIERTQKYLKIMATAIRASGPYRKEALSWDMDFFIMSAQLHDVGKIAIKDDILQKTTMLTDEEYDEMKKHTTYGVNIIKKMEEKTTERIFLKHAQILAGGHHEKWDGTGYPLGLKEQEIPVQARLMAIADVYDALTTERHYKKALSHTEAVRIIEESRGIHFEPYLVDIFLKHEKEFEEASIMYGTSSQQSEGDIIL